MSLRVLAVSGSLRANSSNTAALKAAITLAPPGMEIVLFEGLAALPRFNPDLDTDEPPAIVKALRHEIGAIHGLLISSPEYARGIAGSMKNALDWLVSSFEFSGKPVAVINASPRASYADAQMRLILSTMSERLIEDASITLNVMGRGLGADAIVRDEELSVALRAALVKFDEAIQQSE